jgi:hypothetical protein
MDPFLEHPLFFPDLHGAMHSYIRESLQAVLPAPYFAVINERLWVESSARPIEPDSVVIHRQGNGSGQGGSATAVATRTQPLVFEVVDDERREMFVEVRTRLPDDNERIVTAIEVLSPTNKTPGEKGRNLYVEKQKEVLDSDIHLVEIDLLRGGMHTTPMSLEQLQHKVGQFDYHVSVHRFDERGRFYIYAWKLDSPLPEIAVPLLPGDGGVPLDLQAVFTRCYDTGPYRRRVRYDVARLDPSLDEKRATWAKQLVAAAAVRT